MPNIALLPRPPAIRAEPEPVAAPPPAREPRRYRFGWHLQGGHLCLHPTTATDFPAPLSGPCRLTLHLHLPIPPEWSMEMRNEALLGTTRPLPEPDAAILGGALLKALCGMVMHESHQVVAFTLTRHYSLRPRLEILAQGLA